MRRLGLVLIAIVSLNTPAAAKATGDTPEAQRATRALNLLEAQGFAADLEERSHSAFLDFRQQGKDFVATIIQKGRTFVVIVDPDTGQVKRQD